MWRFRLRALCSFFWADLKKDWKAIVVQSVATALIAAIILIIVGV